MNRKGLVIVLTGDGKGKTSAALGMALRACGRRMYVSMIQFIKSRMDTGESMAAERLKPELEFLTLGKGFVTAAALEYHKMAASSAMSIASQRVRSGFWDMVILDEINNAVDLELIDVSEVLDLISIKPPKLHLVLTGRDAHPEVIAAADLVTEMRSIKHPYDKGIPAQEGIDF